MQTNIDFYLKGQLHAARSNVSNVPRVGETVRLKDGVGGKVTEVEWDFGRYEHAAVAIIYIGQSK